MKKLILIVSATFFVFMIQGIALAYVLDFEDADGTNWNGPLYGQPIFGPGEPENYYYGFNYEGWRVYDKDGVEAVYGTGSYIYQGTNGDRSIGRTTFDPKYISRTEDFYFEGALLSTVDNTDPNPLKIQLIGYNDGSQVWYEEVIFDQNDGLVKVENFISSFADVAVDSVRFHAWETYNSSFVLDDFTYSDLAPVPIPGAVFLFGSGIIGLIGIRRKKN